MKSIYSLFIIALSFAAINCDWLDNDFPPGVPVVVSNPMFFGISETCLITATDSNDVFTATMNSGTGTLNGKDVNQGLNVTVSNGDSLIITASAYASVTITNTGNSLVHAACSLGKRQAQIYYKAYKTVNRFIKSNDIGSYDFAPNSPVSISNPLLWSINASCNLKTSDTSDVINAKMNRGTGKVNGNAIGSGSAVSVKNTDILTIQASALAQVQLTNTGATNVHADCGLSNESIRELYLARGFLEKYFN